MQSLFPDANVPDRPPVARTDGPFAGVALEQGIDRVFDYSIPRDLVAHLQVGQRVRVPLGRGNKPTTGYVVSIHPTTTYPRIKAIAKIEDDRVLIPPTLMELARWISRYYIAPLGVVLESVIPSAVKKRIGIAYRQMVRPAKPPDELQAIFEVTKPKKRRALVARLLQIEPGGAVELARLAAEARTTPPTVRKLARLGLITIKSEVDLPTFTDGARTLPEPPTMPTPNDDQRRVLDELLPRVTGGGFSVNLLLGVTGSGKTEIYLRCIAETVARGRQAIVLVPEIALTPQTVRRFTARFPRVAILHSGLGGTDRHRHWQQILTGRAQVVVGARSAIFAPVPRLGMIVVDEEHESSYKQDNAPRYQARDVAIKRAQLEGIPILLGSATPSLESYWKAGGENCRLPNEPGTSEGRNSREATSAPLPLIANRKSEIANPYHLLSLPTRVTNLSLPHVELIDMKLEARMRQGVRLISRRLEHLLRATVDAGQQAILLLNRRGYSNFVYCSSCGEAVGCKYCDKTMTYHRSAGAAAGGATVAEGAHTGQLHCHYCLAVNPLPVVCPECGKKLTLFGLGTQRVEEELARQFPDVRFARVDSDSMRHARDYERVLSRFATGDIQVLLGTQMIAKGLDYPNVTLVGVVSGDTALALPDFRAAERTFQLITQVAGRAGRGEKPGRVVLQTFNPDDPTIRYAVGHDYAGFAASELKSRREVGLPPFARMVRIVLRDQEREKLLEFGAELATAIMGTQDAQDGQVLVKGPMPCAIGRIAGYQRDQIVLTGRTAPPLQRLLATVRETGLLSKADRVAVDVDPVSLL